MEDEEKIWWRIEITEKNHTYFCGPSIESLELAKIHLENRKKHFRKNTRNTFKIIRFETKKYEEKIN